MPVIVIIILRSKLPCENDKKYILPLIHNEKKNRLLCLRIEKPQNRHSILVKIHLSKTAC